jgi:hypothetical protein
MATTTQPRVTSKGGTDHEEKRPPTRNDQASRMIAYLTVFIPFSVIAICFRLSRPVDFGRSKKKKKKTTRKAGKKSLTENFQGGVVAVAILEVISMCPPFNELSWREVQRIHFLNQSHSQRSGRQQKRVEQCARSSFSPLSSRTTSEHP